MLQPSGFRTAPLSGACRVGASHHPQEFRGQPPGLRRLPKRTRMAADSHHLGIVKRTEQAREPLLVCDRVVVDEHDVLAPTAGDRRIARRGQAAWALVGHDLDLIGKTGTKLCLQRLIVIDNYDHLARRRVLGLDRSHAVDSLLEPLGRERAHHHGRAPRVDSRHGLGGVHVCLPVPRHCALTADATSPRRSLTCAGMWVIPLDVTDDDCRRVTDQPTGSTADRLVAGRGAYGASLCRQRDPLGCADGAVARRRKGASRRQLHPRVAAEEAATAGGQEDHRVRSP